MAAKTVLEQEHLLYQEVEIVAVQVSSVVHLTSKQ